jgi:hypothetical protein
MDSNSKMIQLRCRAAPGRRPSAARYVLMVAPYSASLRAGIAPISTPLHVCDWLTPTRHMLTDRGMMGEGIIEIRKIRGWVEDAGYNGYAEAEILSDVLWSLPPDEIIRRCVEAHRQVV